MVHALLVTLLMCWSWQRWTEIEIDAGWNLYTFWKVSEGQLLYRDMHSSFGPFSVYFCALVFRIFGVSIRALALFDAALILLMAQMIFRIFSSLSERVAGLTVSCCFLLVFAFSQYQLGANYNYVTPYKFEALHGSFLIIAGMFFFSLGTRASVFWAGLCWGASLTTCVEIAVTGTALAGLRFLIPALRREPLRKAEILPFLLGGAVVPSVFLVFLARHFPFSEALFHDFSAFLAPFQHQAVMQTKFYQRLVGADEVSANLLLMAEAVGIYALAALATGALAKGTASWPSPYRRPLGFLLAATATGLLYFPNPDAAVWPLLFRGLPVVSGVTCLAALIVAFKNARWLLLSQWALAAFLLSLRAALHLQLKHYGFYAAMPSALLAVFVAISIWPRWIKARGWNSETVQAFFLGATLAAMVICFQESNLAYRSKNFPVGDGADTILGVDPSIAPDAVGIAAAVDWIKENTPSFATLLVLPDGLMINYLARRAHPGSTTMLYFAYNLLGEDAILAPWVANPPDYVLLIDRDFSEYGVPYFGLKPEYGKKTMDWVRLRYHRLKVIGALPLQGDGRFGIEILQRN